MEDQSKAASQPPPARTARVLNIRDSDTNEIRASYQEGEVVLIKGIWFTVVAVGEQTITLAPQDRESSRMRRDMRVAKRKFDRTKGKKQRKEERRLRRAGAVPEPEAEELTIPEVIPPPSAGPVAE